MHHKEPSVPLDIVQTQKMKSLSTSLKLREEIFPFRHNFFWSFVFASFYSFFASFYSNFAWNCFVMNLALNCRSLFTSFSSNVLLFFQRRRRRSWWEREKFEEPKQNRRKWTFFFLSKSSSMFSFRFCPRLWLPWSEFYDYFIHWKKRKKFQINFMSNLCEIEVK